MLTIEEYGKFEDSKNTINSTIENVYTLVKTICEDLFKCKYLVSYNYDFFRNELSSFMCPSEGKFFLSLELNLNKYSMHISIYKHISGVKLSPPKHSFEIHCFNEKTRDDVKKEIKNNILLCIKKEKE